MGNVAPLTAAQRRALADLSTVGALRDRCLVGVVPTVGPEGVRVAAIRDLAAMKLAAIARRGIRRDFWDLYVVLGASERRLRAALHDYRDKFGISEANVYHVIHALGWFEEAERDRVMPRGLTDARWKAIKAWFEQAAARELRRRTSKPRRK